ncbi:MAG: universal stress protein [Acidobacteria bacterium]|nr:universal stress protein [Acidobacteriota bacterium]
MFKKILVGTDGSDSAAKAVEHALGLAKKTGAELLVVHAYPSPGQESGPPFGPAEPTPYVEIGKSILQDVERRFAGAKLRTLLREGAPEDVIVEAAEDEGVDLVVVGNRGMAGTKRFLLGSVPNRVSHHAPCTVLIVHTT